MTALRQKMIEAMRQRGFAQRTHTTYLMVITDLACYFHRSPDTLSTDDLQHFFHLLGPERGLSAASCRVDTRSAPCAKRPMPANSTGSPGPVTWIISSMP